MQRFWNVTLITIFLTGFVFSRLQAREPESQKAAGGQFYSPLVPDNYQLSNINNITSWISRDGRSAHTPESNVGGIYPKNTAGVVYQDGIMWGGFVNDVRNPGLVNIRVSGQTYRSGTQPGHIITPGTSTNPPELSDPDNAKIYRIRRDWQSLSIGHPDLISDAATVYRVSINLVTTTMQQALLDDYAFSWNNWPTELGAPYEDLNGNGVYDSGVDEPGLQGADQVIWLVINDALAEDLYNSPPIGLEVQITLWGYKSNGPLGQAQYKRYRIINKSGLEIDDMYLSWWSDQDIGVFTNDLVGCNESLNLGFTYNGNPTDSDFDDFGLPPSAAGYALLQGPIEASPGDTAWFDFERRAGYRNLPMTSHSYFAAGTPIADPPFSYNGTLAWYNMMQGYQPSVSIIPYTHTTGPNAGQPTNFPFNGNPLTLAGDVDGIVIPPGDRRSVLSTGGFDMQPGDTQEVVVALVGGNTGSGDNLTSLAALFQNVEAIHNLYGQPVTPYPATTFAVMSANATNTTAVIQADLGYLDNVLAAEVIFESVNGIGTNFSVSLFDDGMHNDEAAGDGIWGNETTVNNRKYPYSATVSVIRSSGNVEFPGAISNLRFRPNPEIENLRVIWENALQDGQINNGEKVHIAFDVQNIDQLNGIDNFFARNFLPESQNQLAAYPDVIAAGVTVGDPALFFLAEAAFSGDSLELNYSLNFDNHSVNGRRTLPVTNWTPGTGWGDTLHIASVSGPSRNIKPIVANPALLNSHQYQITFDSVTAENKVVWHLLDLNENVQKLQNQPVAMPDDIYFPHPVVDGVEYQVISPVPGVTPGDDGWQVVSGNRPISWAGGDGFDFEGFNGAIGWSSPNQVYGGGLPYVKPNALKDVLLVFAQVADGSVLYNPAFDQTGGDPNVSYGYRFGRGFSIPPQQPEFVPFIINTAGGYSYQDFTRSVPLSAWDVTDVNNPRRLAIGHLENNQPGGLVDGKYWPPSYTIDDNILGAGPREWLFIYDTDYSEIPDPALEVELTSNQVPIMYFLTVTRRGEVPFSPGGTGEDQFLFKANIANIPGDTLVVTAAPAAIEPDLLPTAFDLAQNYPNPFNPTTEIAFAIPNPADVKLEIYNVLGQKVRTLVNERKTTGRYQMIWDGRNNSGVIVASGVYFYRLSAGTFVKSRKMILLK